MQGSSQKKKLKRWGVFLDQSIFVGFLTTSKGFCLSKGGSPLFGLIPVIILYMGSIYASIRNMHFFCVVLFRFTYLIMFQVKKYCIIL